MQIAIGIFITGSIIVVTPSGDQFILLENGDSILLESGSKIILEG